MRRFNLFLYSTLLVFGLIGIGMIILYCLVLGSALVLMGGGTGLAFKYLFHESWYIVLLPLLFMIVGGYGFYHVKKKGA
jgi:hypothetical protein